MSDGINKKLDAIDSRLAAHEVILSSIDKTLALQAQNIEHHIKRTDTAEENLELLRGVIKPLEQRHHFWSTLKATLI